MPAHTPLAPPLPTPPHPPSPPLTPPPPSPPYLGGLEAACIGPAISKCWGVLFRHSCPLKALRQIHVRMFQNGKKKKQSSYMVLQCSKHGDIGSFSEMTIEIGPIRSV